MLILGIHKDESNNTIGNYIVEGTKPSTKDKVINVETQYYENPGHHDLKDGNMPYNSTKAIIPDNHVKLWENSVKIDSDPKNSEPYRVCRRPLFLRECPDEKSKIHP